ncbi:nuclear transport factor 2 family protein [Microbacterium lacus]|uniref:nuclear transport factor 2 family protein n=1 Tax=Microbacterium lacus TaxID=415217 RepID=UPI00384F1496
MSNVYDLYWQLVEAIQKGDNEKTRSLLAPDFVLHQDPGMPYGGTYEGPDAFMDHIAHIFGTAWGGTNFTPEFQLVDDENQRINTVVHLEGNIGPNKTHVETWVNEIWEFRDGKAVKERNWYWNTPAITRALAGED